MSQLQLSISSSILTQTRLFHVLVRVNRCAPHFKLRNESIYLVIKNLRTRSVNERNIGGTDICSLFAGMNTALPVYRGEIQCRMLGMAIETFTPTGTLCPPGTPGELVCVRPFPCQPVGFWPLPGFSDTDSSAAVEAAKSRYQSAYFAEFKNVWCECEREREREGVASSFLFLIKFISLLRSHPWSMYQ